MLNNLLAPPPYVYTPSTGRWAVLIFGNVSRWMWALADPIRSICRSTTYGNYRTRRYHQHHTPLTHRHPPQRPHRIVRRKVVQRARGYWQLQQKRRYADPHWVRSYSSTKSSTHIPRGWREKSSMDPLARASRNAQKLQTTRRRGESHHPGSC